MDYTQILIAGALGAAGGGLGALLGGGIGKLFPEKARQIIMVIFVVLGITLSQPVTDKFKAQSMESQIRAGMIEESKFMAFIADNFPVEFDATIQAIAKNPTAKVAEAEGFALTSSIRQDNASFVWKAPTESINDSLKASNDLLLLIRNEYGTKACADFLLQGPPGIPEILGTRQSDFENSNLMRYKVIVDGRDNPIERTLSTDEDWNNFFSAWLTADGTEAMQAAVTSPQSAKDSLCNAWISMTDQLLEMDDPGSDRIKAQLVHISATG